MTFLRLNFLKLIVWYIIAIVGALLFSFIAVYYANAKGATLDVSTSMIISSVLLTFIWVLKIIGWLVLFSRTEKIIRNTELQRFFDDGNFTAAIINKNAFFKITQKSLEGTIKEYPVRVYMNTPANRSAYTTMDFEFYTIKKSDRYINIVPIKLDSFGVPKGDYKDLVMKYADDLIKNNIKA